MMMVDWHDLLGLLPLTLVAVAGFVAQMRRCADTHELCEGAPFAITRQTNGHAASHSNQIDHHGGTQDRTNDREKKNGTPRPLIGVGIQAQQCARQCAHRQARKNENQLAIAHR